MTNNRSAFVIAVLTDYWAFDIEECSGFKILPKLDAGTFKAFLPTSGRQTRGRYNLYTH
jgi:hypothetical protein